MMMKIDKATSLWVILSLMIPTVTHADTFIHKVKPPVSDIRVEVWLNEAIISTYTYNDKNIIEQQKKAAGYFTSKAWLAYSKALDKAGLLDVVKKQKYSVSAVATQPPTILKKALVAGQYFWQAKMPILVYFNNADHPQSQYLEITTRIFYAPDKKPARPLAIDSFYAKKIPPPPCPPKLLGDKK